MKRAYKACRSGIGPPSLQNQLLFPRSPPLHVSSQLVTTKGGLVRSKEGEIVAPHHTLLRSLSEPLHPPLPSSFVVDVGISCPPLLMPILLFFSCVCAPKLTVKRANRKIITVKESTNGAFPRLTSIIITPRTAERRPGGRRTNGRVGGERTRSQRAAWQAGRRGAGVQVLVALRACVRLAPSFPRSSLAPRLLFLLSLMKL